MSQPFIVGETLHKAFWTRSCLRSLTGTVILANGESFYVQWDGGQESLPQNAPAGWCRTIESALGNVLDRLTMNLRRTEHDILVIRGQIQSTKTLQAALAAREPQEQAQ